MHWVNRIWRTVPKCQNQRHRNSYTRNNLQDAISKHQNKESIRKKYTHPRTQQRKKISFAAILKKHTHTPTHTAKKENILCGNSKKSQTKVSVAILKHQETGKLHIECMKHQTLIPESRESDWETYTT